MPHRLIITGRVQGVGFRAFAKGVANALGVAGWVRNRADGAVEVVAEGDVDGLIARLRQGPPYGQVDAIERVACDEHIGAGFSIRR